MKNQEQTPFYQNVVSRKNAAHKKHTSAEQHGTESTKRPVPEKAHAKPVNHAPQKPRAVYTAHHASGKKGGFSKVAPKAAHSAFSYTPIGNIFAPLTQQSRAVLESFDAVAQSVRPLNSKQFLQLPYAVRDLSHLLTDERGSRRAGYMNGTAELSAYIRYFHWWNLYRLTAVFAGLGAEAFAFLKDGDCLLDIGSGPLTVPQALWIARPELRSKKLTFYALDTSQSALAVGEELFLAVAARLSAPNESPWTIVRVKGAYGTSIRKKAAAVFCANMFNELYQNSARPIEEEAKYCAKDLRVYGANECAVFVAEPGIPRSARFVSLLRDAFLRAGATCRSPCPHARECACPGTKNAKWCHFVQNTDDAPEKLQKLSDAAFLHKERATVSFVFAAFASTNCNGVHKTGGAKTVAGEMSASGANMHANADTTETNGAKTAFAEINDSGADTGKTDEAQPAVGAKEKVTLKTDASTHTEYIRVISDEIALPHGACGRYACSAKGLVLLGGNAVRALASGALIAVEIPANATFRTDEKSGALIVPIG